VSSLILKRPAFVGMGSTVRDLLTLLCVTTGRAIADAWDYLASRPSGSLASGPHRHVAGAGDVPVVEASLYASTTRFPS
jgi:hypothetical protein